ncbi:MAG TPA: nuclear transport factor 2 family protein [Kofleriaceae bacterium]|jgi:hypothetical protein
MRFAVAVIVVGALAGVARADQPDPSALAGGAQAGGLGALPAFAWVGATTHIDPREPTSMVFVDLPEATTKWEKLSDSVYEEKQVYWYSAELAAADGPRHATALFELRDGAWCMIAAADVAAIADSVVKVAPHPLADETKGAAALVKRFREQIGSPKVMRRYVSSRNDVVMFGSAPGERVVGGEQVREKLLDWGLAFKVRDGIRAGVDRAGRVGWVAANVDAARPGGKPQPYRLFLVYERADDDGWMIVAANFSAVTK